ncbi:flagellar basal body-associated FliL family protein [Ponticoccus gilvus]|nr:flagellar basal body-associated FliL family protein [Enemella evansiae]
MIKKLLPILLALVGTGAGVGAGLFLMPAGEDHADATECLPPDDAVRHETVEAAPDDPDLPDATREYVKLSNQFVVPIMGSERVRALVVASLSVEVSIGATETVYAREPKLRDVFLQVMFDHANIGGFEGAFTTGERMKILRGALLDAARSVLGSDVSDVLITEIARQEA